jgi:hypothetical protein
METWFMIVDLQCLHNNRLNCYSAGLYSLCTLKSFMLNAMSYLNFHLLDSVGGVHIWKHGIPEHIAGTWCLVRYNIY